VFLAYLFYTGAASFFEKSYVLYIHAKFFSGSTIDLKIISKLGKKYLVYLVRFW